MFRKFKIILALICLTTFSVAAVADPFNDFPLDFFNRSVCKIKNPTSPFSKIKPVKFIAVIPSPPDTLEPGGFKTIPRIHENGDFDSFHCSLSNRAPPFLS